MPGTIRILPLVALGLVLTACNLSLFPEALPTLFNVNGAELPAGPAGSTVICRGAGFGDVQGSGRVVFTPTGGGLPLFPTVASWTAAAVVATVPVAAPGQYAVSVQGGGGITSGARLFTVTAPAPFNASAVTWTAGPSLPGAVSGAGLAFAQIASGGYVYAVGGAGAGGAPVATVSYSVVAANGTLGAWLPTTALPNARAFTAVVAATKANSFMTTDGFLYVLGGASDAAGTPVSTVYRAPFNADGSLGNWTSITALLAPLRSIGAAVLYGSLYVAGGAGAGNSPVATVYRSAIQSANGVTPLTWQQQASLPTARARFGLGASGLYLYAFGGDSIALAPNDTAGAAKRLAQIVYAKLNPSTGDIATWTTSATALADARSAHPALTGGGNVLLTAGLYTGASTHTSEATYAALNADGSVGTFATASPTTSINSLCGCNLFNNGGVGYLGGNGSFHVLIAGGDDVNAVGTRRMETFVY